MPAVRQLTSIYESNTLPRPEPAFTYTQTKGYPHRQKQCCHCPSTLMGCQISQVPTHHPPSSKQKHLSATADLPPCCGQLKLQVQADTLRTYTPNSAATPASPRTASLENTSSSVPSLTQCAMTQCALPHTVRRPSHSLLRIQSRHHVQLPAAGLILSMQRHLATTEVHGHADGVLLRLQHTG